MTRRISPATTKRTILALLLAAVCTGFGTGSARADRCDDIAAQLKGQIDGLTLDAPAQNQIRLTHPAVQRASLGCASRNITNEVFAATEAKKPSADFFNFVAKAAALVFTIPVDNARDGAMRCVKRIGLIRGPTVATRYKGLDIRCSRSKTETMVSISRERDT